MITDVYMKADSDPSVLLQPQPTVDSKEHS